MRMLYNFQLNKEPLALPYSRYMSVGNDKTKPVVRNYIHATPQRLRINAQENIY